MLLSLQLAGGVFCSQLTHLACIWPVVGWLMDWLALSHVSAFVGHCGSRLALAWTTGDLGSAPRVTSCNRLDWVCCRGEGRKARAEEEGLVEASAGLVSANVLGTKASHRVKGRALQGYSAEGVDPGQVKAHGGEVYQPATQSHSLSELTSSDHVSCRMLHLCQPCLSP